MVRPLASVRLQKQSNFESVGGRRADRHQASRPSTGRLVRDPQRSYPYSWLVHVLAVAFVAVSPFAGAFEGKLAGVNVDLADVILLPLVARLAMLARPARDMAPTFWREMPWRWLWCSYGIILAVAYARWSYNAGYLGVGAPYQFYRYCWKPMLLYPVAFYMAARPAGIRLLVGAIILGALVNAVVGIQQSRAGLEVRGFLSLTNKNALADTLLVPVFLALDEGLYGTFLSWRLIACSSGVLMAGALWYAVSRGALIAASVGALAYFLVSGKRWRFAAAAVAVPAVVLLTHPDFTSSSAIVSRYSDIGQGAESANLQWRIQQRWPHFIEIIESHPWLGVGDSVDATFGENANTPHNGYIGLAVKAGIPATLLFLMMVTITLKRALRLTRSGFSVRAQGRGAAAFAGTTALCVHSFVETSFDGTTAITFWIVSGIVMALSAQQPAESNQLNGHTSRRIARLGRTSPNHSRPGRPRRT